MAEVSFAVFGPPIDTIVVETPPKSTYVDGINGFITSGENIILLEAYVLTNGLKSRIGRILEVRDGPSLLLVQFYVTADQYALTGVNVPALRPPTMRTYIRYSPEVILSNYVRWVPSCSMDLGAFIFTKEDTDNGSTSLAVGMSNAFTVRYRTELDSKNKGKIVVSSIENCFRPFPEHDCHSHRKWDLVLRIAQSLSNGLCSLSLAQRLSKTIKVHVTQVEWAYLLQRLENDHILPINRKGVTTVHITRQWASREAVKRQSTKTVIRLDSQRQMCLLKGVFGGAILVGLRKKPPSTPAIRPHQVYSHSVRRMEDIDYVNTLANLPLVSPEAAYKPYTRSRGIDLLYDPVSHQMLLKIRYQRVKCTNIRVRAELGIEVVGQNANRPIEQVASRVEVQVGTVFEFQNAIYCVARIDGYNVECLVEESENPNVQCDSTVVFSLEETTQHASNYATT
jgi:hypothetical protein